MDDSDPKNLVAESYNDIASSYNSWAVSKSSPRDVYLVKLLSRLPPTSRILELGCGGGLPVTKLLLDYVGQESAFHNDSSSRSRVVANDISSQQIAAAKRNAPGAEYTCGDMTTLEFPDDDFNAVVSFFSIFHIPRDEQPKMVGLISKWLQPGGYFVGSLGTKDDAQIQGDFFGKNMYWSSFDVEMNRKMITDAGMRMIVEEVLDATDPADTDDPDHGVKFWWFLAQK